MNYWRTEIERLLWHSGYSHLTQPIISMDESMDGDSRMRF